MDVGEWTELMKGWVMNRWREEREKASRRHRKKEDRTGSTAGSVSMRGCLEVEAGGGQQSWLQIPRPA